MSCDYNKMNSENKKSDAEEILSEFQNTHEDKLNEEPQVETKPEQTYQTRNMVFVGTKPIMSYVTATLTQLASLPIVTVVARGKRITQAIDVSQMIVKRMNEVGYEIADVRISSDPLVSRDGKERHVSKIEIDLKNSSGN